MENWVIGKRPWWQKILKAGGKGEDRGWLDGITNSNGHEPEQAPGVDDVQGSLACCSPLGHKESDTAKPRTKVEFSLLLWT